MRRSGSLQNKTAPAMFFTESIFFDFVFVPSLSWQMVSRCLKRAMTLGKTDGVAASERVLANDNKTGRGKFTPFQTHI
eukprot:COSAG01_NODE_1693_length_9470_cov_3.036602_2_plen_78_part_00